MPRSKDQMNFLPEFQTLDSNSFKTAKNTEKYNSSEQACPKTKKLP
jgi:hypothetical protein